MTYPRRLVPIVLVAVHLLSAAAAAAPAPAAAAPEPAGVAPEPAGVAGVAVTIRSAVPPGTARPRPGDVVVHSFKDGKAGESVTVYERGDAEAAALAPGGDQVTFRRADGSIAAAGTKAKGPVMELAPPATAAAGSSLQWPAGDGGRWVFYLAGKGEWAGREMHRLNVDTKQTEVVAAFNMTPGAFSLTQDATRTAGRFATRPKEWDGVVGYDLSHGDGDLYRRLIESGAGGGAVSFDGSLLLVDDDDFGWRVLDWNGKQLAAQSEPAEEKDAGPEKPPPAVMHWAVNSGRWFLEERQRTGAGDQRGSVAVLVDWAEMKPVPISRAEAGRYHLPQGVWVDDGEPFGLGFFSGEAPYTVEFKPGGGAWTWDFGDDTPTAKSETARHTFEESGVYTVKATRAGVVLEGQVTVEPQTEPRAVSADVLSDRRVLVQFDESVRTDRLKLATKSGNPVKKSTPDRNRRAVLVELERPLGAAGDALSVGGATDDAQVPNAMEPAKLSLKRPAWPSSRAGLVFLWENESARNLFFDEAAGVVRGPTMLRHGRGRFDRYGTMSLQGGRFESGGVPHGRVPVGEDGSFSIELVARPAAGTGGGPLLTLPLPSDGAREGLRIIHDGTHGIAVSVRAQGGEATEPEKQAFKVSDGTAIHQLHFSYKPPRLVCYLNGVRVMTWEVGPAQMGFPVRFGGSGSAAGESWHGSIEGVAIYSRALGADEVEKNHQTYRRKLSARKDPPRLTVEAKLLAKTNVPALADIAPYRDALVVYEYEVLKVVEGKYDGKRIRVGHLGLIDAETTDAARRQAGTKATLVLENLADRPDMETVLLANTLPENFDLPVFVDADR